MRFHIEQTRDIAAHLCGRRLYQEMLVWETAEQTVSDEADLEFARIWRPIPKLVFSRTLNSVERNARLAAAAIAEDLMTNTTYSSSRSSTTMAPRTSRRLPHPSTFG